MNNNTREKLRELGGNYEFPPYMKSWKYILSVLFTAHTEWATSSIYPFTVYQTYYICIYTMYTYVHVSPCTLAHHWKCNYRVISIILCACMSIAWFHISWTFYPLPSCCYSDDSTYIPPVIDMAMHEWLSYLLHEYYYIYTVHVQTWPLRL